jgi:glycosyltransferase involved in cell wall biosynthesis
MRIAQVAPLFVRIPPREYGGTERVVHALGEELSRRGRHELVLFGPGTSEWPGELVPICPRPLWEMHTADPLAYRVLQVEEVVRRSGDFDVIHSHVDYLPWLAVQRLRAPLVTTLHGRLDLPELRPLFAMHPEQPLISITDAQRAPVADLWLNWVATVHHGFRFDDIYHMGKGDGGYLAFLGRIAPEKGPATAIRVAIKAGIPIKVAARVDPINFDYYQQEVEPLLSNPGVEWVGEQDDRGKDELLGGAIALLAPIDWDEPFGLVIVEALATGTPVISRPRGSLPEIMRHGEHGFLVWTEEEMVAACRRVGEIDRSRCRQWVLEQFTVERMADGYERAYSLAQKRSFRSVAPGAEPAARVETEVRG